MKLAYPYKGGEAVLQVIERGMASWAELAVLEPGADAQYRDDYQALTELFEGSWAKHRDFLLLQDLHPTREALDLFHLGLLPDAAAQQQLHQTLEAAERRHMNHGNAVDGMSYFERQAIFAGVGLATSEEDQPSKRKKRYTAGAALFGKQERVALALFVRTVFDPETGQIEPEMRERIKQRLLKKMEVGRATFYRERQITPELKQQTGERIERNLESLQELAYRLGLAARVPDETVAEIRSRRHEKSRRARELEVGRTHAEQAARRQNEKKLRARTEGLSELLLRGLVYAPAALMRRLPELIPLKVAATHGQLGGSPDGRRPRYAVQSSAAVISGATTVLVGSGTGEDEVRVSSGAGNAEADAVADLVEEAIARQGKAIQHDPAHLARGIPIELESSASANRSGLERSLRQTAHSVGRTAFALHGDKILIARPGQAPIEVPADPSLIADGRPTALLMRWLIVASATGESRYDAPVLQTFTDDLRTVVGAHSGSGRLHLGEGLNSLEVGPEGLFLDNVLVFPSDVTEASWFPQALQDFARIKGLATLGSLKWARKIAEAVPDGAKLPPVSRAADAVALAEATGLALELQRRGLPDIELCRIDNDASRVHGSLRLSDGEVVWRPDGRGRADLQRLLARVDLAMILRQPLQWIRQADRAALAVGAKEIKDGRTGPLPVYATTQEFYQFPDYVDRWTAVAQKLHHNGISDVAVSNATKGLHWPYHTGRGVSRYVLHLTSGRPVLHVETPQGGGAAAERSEIPLVVYTEAPTDPSQELSMSWAEHRGLLGHLTAVSFGSVTNKINRLLDEHQITLD